MMRCLLILSGQQVKRNIQLQNILVLSGVLVHLNTVVTLMVIYQCTCDISRFLLFSYSTAGNGYPTGRQCGYSVAPINSCKSLLSAFAEGNLHFQIHEAALHVKGKHLKATRLPVNTRARFT